MISDGTVLSCLAVRSRDSEGGVGGGPQRGAGFAEAAA
jgi:hypothetical protein